MLSSYVLLISHFPHLTNHSAFCRNSLSWFTYQHSLKPVNKKILSSLPFSQVTVESHVLQNLRPPKDFPEHICTFYFHCLGWGPHPKVGNVFLKSPTPREWVYSTCYFKGNLSKTMSDHHYLPFNSFLLSKNLVFKLLCLRR